MRMRRRKLQRRAKDPGSFQGHSSRGISHAGKQLIDGISHREVWLGKHFMLWGNRGLDLRLKPQGAPEVLHADMIRFVIEKDLSSWCARGSQEGA